MSSVTLPVTPIPALASSINQGGQAVRVANGGINGGFLTNPATAEGQGLAEPEPLFIDSVGGCGELVEGGTIFALAPGQSWDFIPGQTTPTFVNAASNGHNFSVVIW